MTINEQRRGVSVSKKCFNWKRKSDLLTICTTSSSSRMWSIPTFCGLCFEELPQTQALQGGEDVSRKEKKEENEKE